MTSSFKVWTLICLMPTPDAEASPTEANKVLPLKECAFSADKGYDTNAIYSLIKNVYCVMRSFR